MSNRRWAILESIYGYEPWSDELSVGMPIEILHEYSNGMCQCTANGINVLDGAFKGDNGCYDTLLHIDQLNVQGDYSDAYMSGLVFSNGDWIKFFCGGHHKVTVWLREQGYDMSDEIVHITAVDDFCMPHTDTPESQEAVKMLHSYLQLLSDGQYSNYLKYLKRL